MCAITCEQETHKFLLATNAIKRENEVHLINYSEDSNRIDQEQVYSIEGQGVWSISSSPYDKGVFVCGIAGHAESGSEQNYVAIFHMDEESEQPASKEFDKKPLKPTLELVGEHSSHVHSIVWEDSEHNEGFTPKELISADSDKVVIWDLKAGKSKAKVDASLLSKQEFSECTVVKRDPHHSNLLCIGVNNGFYQVDLRDKAGLQASLK